jgi:hypothetical protein
MNKSEQFASEDKSKKAESKEEPLIEIYPSFWREGVYLQIIGIIGIIFIFIWSSYYAAEQKDLMLYSGMYKDSQIYLDSDRFLAKIVISAATNLGILLNLILIGLGSVAKNLYKKRFVSR